MEKINASYRLYTLVSFANAIDNYFLLLCCIMVRNIIQTWWRVFSNGSNYLRNRLANLPPRITDFCQRKLLRSIIYFVIVYYDRARRISSCAELVTDSTHTITRVYVCADSLRVRSKQRPFVPVSGRSPARPRTSEPWRTSAKIAERASTRLFMCLCSRMGSI